MDAFLCSVCLLVLVCACSCVCVYVCVCQPMKDSDVTGMVSCPTLLYPPRRSGNSAVLPGGLCGKEKDVTDCKVSKSIYSLPRL